MDANPKKRYDKAGPQVVKALEKRHFEAYYVSTAAEAVEKVVELIPKEHTVSWGGTATVDALGIKQRLAQEGIALIDRDTAQTPQERQEMLKKALTCGTFLMSSNAISADGQLVNIDGTGSSVLRTGAGHCGGGHEQGGRRSGGSHAPGQRGRRSRQRPAVCRAQDPMFRHRPVRRLYGA